jgi:hypothetical protein
MVLISDSISSDWKDESALYDDISLGDDSMSKCEFNKEKDDSLNVGTK